MTNRALGNQYSKGNTWNIGRVDIYNETTLEHKRVLRDDLNHYINNGFIIGLPPNDKRHTPTIKHCTNDNLVGVSFNKICNKWQAYINYKSKRYGSKLFDNKENAIFYRQTLENLFEQINRSNINISQVDIKQSLKNGEIILWTE